MTTKKIHILTKTESRRINWLEKHGYYDTSHFDVWVNLCNVGLDIASGNFPFGYDRLHWLKFRLWFYAHNVLLNFGYQGFKFWKAFGKTLKLI